MTFKQFISRNQSDRKFTDITDESVRTYLFANGFKLVLADPIALHISKSGHYVAQTSGVVTFIPYGPNGFAALQFLNRDGRPTMNF
jgi:hypothetical protein